MSQVLQLAGDARLQGASAYEIALKHGFEGTEEEWLESLKGSGGLPEIAPSAETELLPLTNASFTYDSFYGWYMYVSTIVMDLSVGDKCKVIFGDDTFYCTVVDVDAILAGYKAMGNMSDFGIESNNEPFLIGFNAEHTIVVAVNDTAPDSHYVAIHKVEASEDEGKFLRIVGGKVAYVAMDIAEEASF